MASNPEPLLGRAEEWRKIADAIDQVRRGSSRTIFIHGEAGIGKTRLVQELTGHAEATGFSVFSGRADDLERLRPFGAVSDGIANFARKTASVRTTLQALEKELSSSPNALEATDRFVELIEELALTHPTCVAMEDLHWADPETIAAVRALNRRLSYLPILFVGTHRPHPQPPELQRLVDLAVGDGAILIELGRLDDDAVSALAGGIVGGLVGPRLAQILSSTSGNPLYATEVVHALREEGALQLESGAVDTDIAELPPTLRLTILRRLSHFPREVLELLKVASVLGSTFHLHELAAMCARPLAAVAAPLEGAIAAKLIEERDGRLAYRHDLIHEAIYQDIPAPIRASMHLDVARMLRSLGTPTVRVAEHMIRGLYLGDPTLFDEAVDLTTHIRFSAPLVALALADKALALDGVPEQRRDELQRYMVWPLAMTGRRHQAERLGRETLRRPQDPAIAGMIRSILGAIQSEDGRSMDAVAELKGVADDPLIPAPVVRLTRIALFAALARAGICDWIESLEHLIAEARQADDRGALTVATGVMVTGRLAHGHVSEAVSVAEEYIEMERSSRSVVSTPYLVPAIAYLGDDRLDDARRACDEGRKRALEAGEVPALAVYSAMEALVCFFGGAWAEGSADATLALELVADGTGSPVTLVLAYVASSQIALRRGNLEEARRFIIEAEHMIAEKGPQWGSDLLGWTKALFLEASGDTPKALASLASGWGAWESVRYLFGRPAFPDLVRLAMAAGDREYAARVTEAAEEGRRRAPDVHSAAAVALRCRGLLEDDADHLLSAVEAYRSTPRVVERASVCEDAARCFARRGKTAEARFLFDEAVVTFEELGAVHDSSRVSAAMRSAGIRRGVHGPRRRPSTGWDALTATEVEIVRLTVEGLTNPRIAERLFISKRTVQAHLSHIFGKLGVSSRVALARIAADRLRDGGS